MDGFVLGFLLMCMIGLLVHTGDALSAGIEFNENYVDEIQIDQIKYVAINIPRYSRSVHFTIWIGESVMKPYALLRYDGLPSLDEYDAKYELASLPHFLKVTDNNPTQSTLYVGIWGGAPLHSYKYFAGSPSSTLFGIDYTVHTCSNELQKGEDCVMMETLPTSIVGSTTSSQLYLDKPKEYSVRIPANMDGFEIAVRINDPSGTLCKSIPKKQRLLEFSMDLYLDQPHEEANSGRQSVLIDHELLCAYADLPYSVDGIPETIDLLSYIEFPLPGTWSVKITLSPYSLDDTTSPIATSRSRRLRIEEGKLSSADVFRYSLEALKRGQKRISDLSNERVTKKEQINPSRELAVTLPLLIHLTSTLYTCPVGYSGYREYFEESLEAADRTHHQRHYLKAPQTTLSNCHTKIIEMSSYRTGSIAQGYFSVQNENGYHLYLEKGQAEIEDNYADEDADSAGDGTGRRVLLETPSEHILDWAPYALLTGILSNSKQHQFIGGNMQVQLLISPIYDPVALGNGAKKFVPGHFYAYLKSLHFLVSMKLNGIPSDPMKFRAQTDNISGGKDEEKKEQEYKEENNGESLADPSGILQVHDDIDVSSEDAMILSSRDALIMDRGQTYFINHDEKKKRGNESGSSDPGEGMPPSFENSTQRYLRGQKISHETVYQSEVMFIWNIIHPYLPGLNDPSGVNGNRFYFRVSKYDILASLTPEERRRASETSAAVPVKGFEVSVQLLFLPCVSSNCEHGTCYVVRGDIDHTACRCNYPWDGDHCDRLIISSDFYKLQVMSLVLSNLAMIPAVVYSYRNKLYVMGFILLLAAITSAFYHMCDMDAYCFDGLSYQSLQVLDVLLTTVCMSMTILFYSPLSLRWHSVNAVMIISLMVPFVVNHATGITNILVALIGSLVFTLALWLKQYLQLICISHHMSPKTMNLANGDLNSFWSALNKYFNTAVDVTIHSNAQFRDPRFVYAPVARDELSAPHIEDATDVEEEKVFNAANELIDLQLAGSHYLNLPECSLEDSDSRTIEMKDRSAAEDTIRTSSSPRHMHRKESLDANSELSDNDKFTDSDPDDSSVIVSDHLRFSNNSIFDLSRASPTQMECGEFILFKIKLILNQIPFLLYTLQFTAVGILIGLVGLLCFALQSRENYWYVHSFWHVFIMFAAFLLLRGKEDFLMVVQYYQLK